MYSAAFNIWNKIKASIPFSLCALLAVCSIMDAGFDEDRDPVESDITFSMQIPGNHAPASRSLSPSDEAMVETVDVLVFDKDGDFRYIAYARDVSGSNGNTVQTFTVTLTTGVFDLMVVANSRDLIKNAFGGYIPKGTSREEIEKGLIMYNSGKWNADPISTDYRSIPMWGEKRNADINPETSFTGGSRIKMSRMLARIDVAVNPAVQPQFKLKEVYLYNSFNQGLVVPSAEAGIWDPVNDRALRPSLLSAWSAPSGFTRYHSEEINETDVACRSEIYTFEATEGTTTTHTANTFIVIGGEYLGEMCYYRLDFSKTTAGVTHYLPILRNHLYDFNITAIGSKGFSTHQLAAQSLPMNIEVDITITDEGEIGYYVYDGQYYLGTDKESAEFWAVPTTGQLKVTTDYPAGWSYTVNDSPDGKGSAVSWLTVTGRTDYGAKNTDILNYSVERNDTSGDRTAYIIISNGKLTLPVAVTQYNKYIESVRVTPSGDIPGSGGDYTFTITGSFDDTAIRARDNETDEIISTGTVAASTTSSSGIVTIPPYLSDDTRTIAFDYFDDSKQLWLTVKTSDQHGFRIESNHQDGTPIPTLGETFTVTVTGSFPTLSLRAVDEDDNLVSGTTTIFEGKGTGTENITVEVNNGTDRIVTLQWSVDGIQWYEISSGLQVAYSFKVMTTHQPGADIRGSGESFTAFVTGNHPEITLRAVAEGAAISEEFIIPAGTADDSTIIRVRNNGTSYPRLVTFQYRTGGTSTWTDITQGNQAAGNFELGSGRLLAQSYAVNGTGSYNMTWAEAMGIDPVYNTIFFRSSDPLQEWGYPADKPTGCNAYYENENMDDLGLWEVPDISEGLNIVNFLGTDVNAPDKETVYLWLSIESTSGSPDATTARVIMWLNNSWSAGHIKPKTGGTGKETWTRCVRSE